MSEQINKYLTTPNVYGLDMASTTGTAPRFTGAPGEDYTQWYKLFMLAVEAKELKPPAIRFQLYCLIDGEAKNFFEYINGENLELKEIFDRLRGRFEIVRNRVDLLNDIENMRKASNETWPGFIERYVILARKCEITEENQVAWITRRLPEKLQLMLATLRLSSVDINMEGIRNVLSVCQTRGLALEHIGTLATDVNAVKSYKRKKKWCEMHKWCNHVTEKCHGLMNKSNSRYNFQLASNTVISCVSTKLVTTVTLPCGEEIKALIDTGSDVSCIRESLELPEIVHSFSGETVIGKWTNPTTLTIFNQTMSKKLLVFKKMSYDMILGMDLLKPLIKIVGTETIFNQDQITAKENSSNIAQLSITEELSRKLTNEFTAEFKSLLAKEINQENICTMRKHCIDTGDNKPICREGNRVPIHYEKQVEEEIESLLARGIIRPSQSPWRSGIVVAPKPNGKIRMCIDYRPINLITTKSAYPMPRIDEILDALSKAKVFSVIDATSGYHQIAMEEKDIQKTAFAWKGQLFEYKRMPFGLCNAPSTFQGTMDAILQKDKWKIAIPYLDDVIVFSESIQEHQEHLKKGFEQN